MSLSRKAFNIFAVQKQIILYVVLLVAWTGLPVLSGARTAPARKVSNRIFRFKEEQNGRFAVWIVDGNKLRDSVYPEWLYGGNGECDRFNPPREIWVDNDISCQEYRYTLAHELVERHLMAHFAWNYADAHDSALMLEDAMRHADSLECTKHEQSLAPVPPIDDDSTKELSWLPDRIKLHDVYLQHFETMDDSLQVWIVDGNVVRRDIFPDFGFSGNDLAYHFIPRNEIWLDNSMSCENIKFSLLTETNERELMAKGLPYDSAYGIALHLALHSMRALYREAGDHLPVLVPTPPNRDTGTGDESSPKTISQSPVIQRHEVSYRGQSYARLHPLRLRRTHLPNARISAPSKVVP